MVLYNFRRGSGLRIVVGIIFTLILMVSSVNASTTINVCSTCTYTSIQDAIDAASSGDTIEVQSGTYDGNLNVDKMLTLKGVDTGTGKPVVKIDAVIIISANGVDFEGFSIKGEAYLAAISITSDNNVIKDNDFAVSVGTVIDLSGSNNKIEGNIIPGPSGGIFLTGANNLIIGNEIDTGDDAINVWSSGNIITGNTILSGSMRGTIYLEGGSRNRIASNYIQASLIGIGIESSNNVITDNTIYNEGVDYPSGLEYMAGIYASSGNNLIYRNNIISEQGHNVIDYASTNQWDNGVIGNHYSNFDEESEGCSDNDQDGICDSSFNIPSYDMNKEIEYLNIGRYAIVSWPPSDSSAEIPEFPSVAIPVISALGLMLIATRRKK